MTDREWHESNLAVQRHERDVKNAAERDRLRAGRERMEKALRDKFKAQAAAAKKAAPPAPPATSGPGWRVLAAPRVAHAILEERALAIWKFCWHESDWPTGLRIKWGQLDDALLGLFRDTEACTARQRGRVLGLYVARDRIILLDEENHRGRPVRDLVETVLHELVHTQVRATSHGEQFQRALASAMSFYDGAPTAPAFMTNAAATPWAGPWAGMKFRPGGLFDPTLEYR